ncbi:MAG: TldD/PmbA family protein [Candidatus Izimaplasma sp.]|nr:TldD/PmbA family protein [Candidatus Izimaplasma bacterium]
MIKEIINLLNEKKNVDEFKIILEETTSNELFFIKDKLNMSRGKNVTHISITVYRNFEKDGKFYKGSSTTKISPTMSIEEISNKVDMASLAASFVNNQYYDLVDPTDDIAPEIKSKFSDGNIIEHISNLVKDLFSEENTVEGANINSCEFFINQKNIRLINSKGVDIIYDLYNGQIELITEASSKTESVELFEVLNFSDYDPEWIKNIVKETLLKTKLRAEAIPLPLIENIPIILTGEAVKIFFEYYYVKASGRMVYEEISQSKIGDIIQSGEIKGDRVTASFIPEIRNSTLSRYYDDDGFFLKEVSVVKESKLINYIADKRYADYLKIKPTGNIVNVVISGGSKSIKELKKDPHLELFNFSDFQMEPITGNFGGEIRLGIYFDGKVSIPITLGSISGNVRKVEQNLYFSKELQNLNGFIGPKIIKISNITIAGN